MTILVFTRNNKLPKIELRNDLDVRFIDFDSTKLDDLLTIAKYRVVNCPTSLVIDNRGKIMLRVKGVVPRTYLNRLAEQN